VVGATLGRGNRALSALSGAALLAASALTRFGVFGAGIASTKDPRYTVVPQRSRVDGGAPARLAHDQRDAVGAGREQLADDRVARDLAGDQEPA
jgi:hypothetical protein